MTQLVSTTQRVPHARTEFNRPGKDELVLSLHSMPSMLVGWCSDEVIVSPTNATKGYGQNEGARCAVRNRLCSIAPQSMAKGKEPCSYHGKRGDREAILR
jgi:hypothetical protein